ncbi:bifunctional cytidylate kinase/GTPase Der [Dermabacteraceae bacterium P7074]
MIENSLIVAIDGPSGSGKSTVSRRVAAELGGGYVDTGSMYRVVTWYCLREGIDLDDRIAVARAASELDLRLCTDPEAPAIAVGETILGDEIRSEEISSQVSRVATNLDVRSVLQQRQREIISQTAQRHGSCVAEGRDITTVVYPDADVRILLTASEEARMARRAKELNIGEVSDADVAQRMQDQVLRRDRDDATVSQFLTAPDGVTTIDTSEMSIDEVVAAVLSFAEAAGALPGEDADGELYDDDAVEAVWRNGLEEYELDEEDRALLDGEIPTDYEGEVRRTLPVLAVVGRPNVGKSTLVNRILGRREAVVEDVPGVTRDRVLYPADWAGRDFMLVDTGGWEGRVQGISYRIAEQAEIAVEMADAIMFVVDATVGVTETDQQLVKVLRRSGKPVVVAANKVDDERGELEAAALWNLGLGEPYPVSGLHGRGSGDLLDAVMAVLPKEGKALAPYAGPRRVALIGRPNVGKSSLLNRLAGENRVVVDSTAGTTRDPVDEKIELGGKEWIFVDTAGIRRRIHNHQGAEFYASLRTQSALEKAEVAIVLLEASEPISSQDLKIIDTVVESGRALVLAFNKWDLIDEERHKQLEYEIATDLAHVAWAPRVNISAETGRAVNKLVPALETALESWDARIPTGRLNAFLGTLVAAHPHPLRGGKQPRILFATQARSRPPRFVVFATGFLEHGYRRFIERRLREDFQFPGTPIEIGVRIREKRKGRR